MSVGRHTASSTFPAVFAATIVASVAVHGLLIAFFPASEPDPLDAIRALTAKAVEEQEAIAATPGEPTCEADIMLASLARATYCATPFAPEDCLAETRHSYEDGMLMCNALVELDADEQAHQAQIALLDVEELELLEPEALMPVLTPEEQKAFEKQQEQAIEEKQEQVQKQQQRPPDGQVVEITPPDVEEDPDNARYVSEYANRVEKQTVARGSTEEMVEKPSPKELAVTETPPDKSPDAAKPPDERPIGENKKAPDGAGALAMRKPGPVEPHRTPQEKLEAGELDGSKIATAEGGLAKKRGDGAISQERRDPDVSERGENGGGGGQPPLPDLRPTEELLERAVGGGSVDHLDDAESGEFTGLNTKRWKYASFFNRVKRMVAQNWEPWKVYARRDPQGQIYGHKTKVTTVKVSLTQNGKLSKIFVVRGSGVEFLDEEAVRAFKAAGPFPNPPTALVDADSKLITFQFSFHVEIGESSNWKIFRSR